MGTSSAYPSATQVILSRGILWERLISKVSVGWPVAGRVTKTLVGGLISGCYLWVVSSVCDVVLGNCKLPSLNIVNTM